MRYSRKGDPDFIHSSSNLKKDVYDKMIKYKEDKRLRNRSLTIELLIIKGLESEGYKIK